MTEKKKRFFESLYQIIDRENGRKLQAYEIIDLLNELNDENKELKKENKSLRKEHERQNNEIKLLREAYSKIPKGIREVWKE